jgi:hypothetical protein
VRSRRDGQRAGGGGADGGGAQGEEGKDGQRAGGGRGDAEPRGVADGVARHEAVDPALELIRSSSAAAVKSKHKGKGISSRTCAATRSSRPQASYRSRATAEASDDRTPNQGPEEQKKSTKQHTTTPALVTQTGLGYRTVLYGCTEGKNEGGERRRTPAAVKRLKMAQTETASRQRHQIGAPVLNNGRLGRGDRNT